jgi:hypothetical protein
MKNITPSRYKCTLGQCPAIYRNADGQLVIIGKRQPKVTAKLVTKGKVGDNEDVIVIDEKFFEDISKARKV